MNYYSFDFYGLKRKLAITKISATKEIANFNLLGDIEFTEKAGDELEKILNAKNLNPDCFVSVETKVAPFVHHMAKRFGHLRYVVLRKNIRGYMSSPKVKEPWNSAPKHARKLVLNGDDEQYIRGKKVIIIDDVVSTGTTMEMAKILIAQIGTNILATCAIFKQGDNYHEDLIYLESLPIMQSS